jgi:DMSO reductase anchor subunit
MQPAFSVIFLTTLLGAGQGLFLALYAVELLTRLGWLAPIGQRFFVIGTVLVLVLLMLGLVASTFHLGRPERGWRAAARWRTSWLSREVIVLPLVMAAVFAYGAAHAAAWTQAGGAPWAAPTVLIGAAAALLVLALFVCTGMIYACLKFLQEWATPLTVLNYLLLGLASGTTLAAAYAVLEAPALAPLFAQAALLLTITALVSRVASLVRNSRLRPISTLQTAIGIKHPRIVQMSQGFMGGSFNTREFFHGRTLQLLRSVKWAFLLLAFAVPALLLAVGLSGEAPAAFLAAFICQYVGLLAERWFFFAQANHPQNLYYQAVA